MFVLLKRKEVGKLEGVKEVHENERTALHGVDMWTKAFDPHTCSNTQATDLENYHWERQMERYYGAPSITKLCLQCYKLAYKL